MMLPPGQKWNGITTVSYTIKIMKRIANCLFFIVLCLISFISLHANEVSETMLSAGNDKVTVKYEVFAEDDGLCITFVEVKKLLGRRHETQYRNTDKVKVLFFDRNGGFRNDKFSSEIGGTDALMVSSDEMDYKWSDKGFVLLEKDTDLKVKLISSRAILSIPIYLAYQEKLHTYKVFANCGVLEISLDESQMKNHRPLAPKSTTITDLSDTNGEKSDSQLAKDLVKRIKTLIEKSTGSDLPEGLDSYVDQLRQVELKVQERDIQSEISNVLNSVEEKKYEIEKTKSDNRKKEEEDAANKLVEENARQECNYLLELLAKDNFTDSDISEMKVVANSVRRQRHSITDPDLSDKMKKAADRCDEVVKNREEAKNRRNIWMIIGGFLLAVLVFIGNQAFQHFRNLRTQKGLEEMQDKIARRAENEAKRRAQSVVRSKIHRAQNVARQKGRELIRGDVNKGDNNKKKVDGKQISI